MQVGDFFDGKYIIEKILGRGGMGIVYKARNIKTETYWSIKEIPKKEDSDINLPAEPNLLKKLEHPALPRLFDILDQDGKLYMIYDYVDGMSLDKKLEAEGKIDEEIVSDWAIQLCKALEYLHSFRPNPIIYRDMKPSNIILADSGAIKLIDFGIAREYKPQMADDTVYIGTRGYASPEQYGTGQTSPASDIYSLGVTLHHLLTGKNPTVPPFGLKPVRHYDSNISFEMEAILLKCTRDNAAERYRSVPELLNELEGLYRKRRKEERRGNSPEDPGDYQNDAAQCLINESCKDAEKIGTAYGGGIGIRKAVLAVWDNAEFGCELAYMAAKHTKGEVLLADLDLLAPKADLFLKIRKTLPKPVHTNIYGHTGFDFVIDAIGKNALTPDLLRQAVNTGNDLKNLYILTGNDRLDNYEYYSEDSVPKLIDKSLRCFDIIILLVNKSIYDAFTLAALLKSDINIAAVKGDVDKLREFNTYIAFLKERQHLPMERTKFILFEYDKASSISLSEASEATQGNLLGKVSISRKRTMYRNLKGLYAAHMEKEIEGEYIKILDKLGLLQAMGTFGKLGMAFSRFFGVRQTILQENR